MPIKKLFVHNSDQFILVILKLSLGQAQILSILICLHCLVQLPIEEAFAIFEQMSLIRFGQACLVVLFIDALEDELAEVGPGRLLVHPCVAIRVPAHVHVVEKRIPLHHCLFHEILVFLNELLQLPKPSILRQGCQSRLNLIILFTIIRGRCSLLLGRAIAISSFNH